MYGKTCGSCELSWLACEAVERAGDFAVTWRLTCSSPAKPPGVTWRRGERGGAFAGLVVNPPEYASCCERVPMTVVYGGTQMEKRLRNPKRPRGSGQPLRSGLYLHAEGVPPVAGAPRNGTGVQAHPARVQGLIQPLVVNHSPRMDQLIGQSLEVCRQPGLRKATFNLLSEGSVSSTKRGNSV